MPGCSPDLRGDSPRVVWVGRAGPPSTFIGSWSKGSVLPDDRDGPIHMKRFARLATRWAGRRHLHRQRISSGCRKDVRSGWPKHPVKGDMQRSTGVFSLREAVGGAAFVRLQNSDVAAFAPPRGANLPALLRFGESSLRSPLMLGGAYRSSCGFASSKGARRRLSGGGGMEGLSVGPCDLVRELDQSASHKTSPVARPARGPISFVGLGSSNTDGYLPLAAAWRLGRSSLGQARPEVMRRASSRGPKRSQHSCTRLHAD